MKAVLVVILGTLSVQAISQMPAARLSQQASQAEQNANSSSQPQAEPDKAQEKQQEVPQPNPAPAVQGPQQKEPEPAQTREPSVPPSPDVSAPSAQPETAAPQASPAPKNEPAKPITRRKRKKTTKQASGPRKTVVRDGGTSEPTSQLAPGMSQDQAKRSQQTTNQLLSSSQENLKRASARTLTSGQQATLEQVKVFIEQANAALKVGDFQRGHNFAMKAHALSEDLLKP